MKAEVLTLPIKTSSGESAWAPLECSPEGPIVLKQDADGVLIAAHFVEQSCQVYTGKHEEGAAGTEGERATWNLTPDAWRPNVMGEAIVEAPFTLDKSKCDPAFIILRSASWKHHLYLGIASYADNEEFWPEARSDSWERMPGHPDIEYYKPGKEVPEIAVETAAESFFSPIRLLENTKYRWALLLPPGSESDGGNRRICDAEESPDQTGLSFISDDDGRGYLERNGKACVGSFNFRNFLGTARLAIGDRELVRLESTSLKIDYETEYLRMLDDLTEEALGNILNLQSITTAHLVARPSANKRHLFGRYILLKATLPLHVLKSSAAQIRAKPHTKLSSTSKWLPASMASGRHAMSDPIGRIRWARRIGSHNKASPHEVLEENRLETSDTPPNQFSKFAMQDFAQLCERIATNADSVGSRHAKEAAEYAEECRRQLRFEHLRSCKDIRQIPFENQVLQKRSGYREIFRAWTKSNLGLGVKELNSDGILSPEAENRDAPKLYELWLISHLKKALRALSAEGVQPIYEFMPDAAGEQIQLFPEGGKYGRDDPVLVVQDADGNLLALYYNRSFTATARPSSKSGRAAVRPGSSYTVELHPDYTIEIIWNVHETEKVNSLAGFKRLSQERLPQHGGSTTYIHFDAKFRIDDVKNLSETDPTKAKAGDIYKMHTYIEAIYGTATSIILYPGKTDADYNKFLDLIPGVSALAIKPDSTTRRSEQSETTKMETKAVNTLTQRIADIIEASRPDAHSTAEPKPGASQTYKGIRTLERDALRSLKDAASSDS